MTKNFEIKIRMTKRFKTELTKYASKKGLSTSEFVRLTYYSYQQDSGARKLVADKVAGDFDCILILKTTELQKKMMLKEAKSLNLTLSRFLRSLLKEQISKRKMNVEL